MTTPLAQQRSAPFSTHARGVPLFNRNRFLDLPRHVARLLLDLRDISSSTFWFLGCQSWLTFWAALTTLCSVTFFTYFGDEYSLAANLDWNLTCFVVILPLLGFVWVSYGRRERALDELSRAKVLMITLFTAHRDWPPEDKETGEHMLAVRSALAAILESMHEYFLASRFYSRYYPYFGFRGAMVSIALDRARHVRRMGQALQTLTAANVALRGAGLSAALEAQLHSYVHQLHACIDQMANIKEFRIPQGVRAMARFYFCLFIPIFYGPYWAYVSQALGYGFSFFFSILLSIALLGLLNLSLALEDPFDNQGMDGIYIDEALYEVEQLIAGPGLGVPAAGVEAQYDQTNGGGEGAEAGGAQQPQQRVSVARVPPAPPEAV